MFSFDLKKFKQIADEVIKAIADPSDKTPFGYYCKKEAKSDPNFTEILKHYLCVCGYYLDCESNVVLAEGCDVKLKDKPSFHVEEFGSLTDFKQALLFLTMEAQGRRILETPTKYSYKSAEDLPVDDLTAFDYRIINFLLNHLTQKVIYDHYRAFFEAPLKTKQAVVKALYFDLFGIVGPVPFPAHNNATENDQSEEKKHVPFNPHENPEFKTMLEKYMDVSEPYVSDEVKADPFFEKSHEAFIKALIDYVLEEDKDRLMELSDKTNLMLGKNSVWAMIWFLVMFESKVRLKGQDEFQLDIRMEDYMQRGGNKVYYPTFKICPQKTADMIIDCAWKTLGSIVDL